MKTGFLYGNARTPKFVYYYYHGKIMQCRKEPWIPPYTYYDTHPAEYPPNYYYECDTMPAGATPPMTCEKQHCITPTIAGGLLDVRTHVCPIYHQPVAIYYWSINPTARIEITASFPTLEVIDPGINCVSGEIYLNQSFKIGVRLVRCYAQTGGHNYVDREYTLIRKAAHTFFNRPFTNNIHIIFEKRPGTLYWDFYFNDEWIFDIYNPQKDRISFYIGGPATEYGHITMDYLRAWVDRERT